MPHMQQRFHPFDKFGFSVGLVRPFSALPAALSVLEPHVGFAQKSCVVHPPSAFAEIMIGIGLAMTAPGNHGFGKQTGRLCKCRTTADVTHAVLF